MGPFYFLRSGALRLNPLGGRGVLPDVKSRLLPLLAVALLAPLVSTLRAADSVKLTRTDGRVRVELGGKLFTEYVFKDTPKPFLYPVLAADGTELMRHFPMKGKGGVAGEVEDHPHHRSLWFTHGDVNGVDFWADGDNKGKIVNESVESSVQGGVGVIRARNKWVAADGVQHLTDETTIRVHGTGDARFLDYEVTLKAPAGKPVVFGDTKEGSMAIRVPLWMTPPHSYSGADKKRVKHEGLGTIVNDSGQKNDDTWGRKSTWVDYHAPKDGKVYGIAMFDHPKNPRFPTWWHVRSYALFAANPFGQHDFEVDPKTKKKTTPPRSGDLTIPAGQSVTFRWRFYFHQGDEKTAKVAEHAKAYAAGK